MLAKPIIRTSNLCKTFVSDGEQFHATRGISIEIFEGEFTIIMGSSGSGKSTLLYLLSGMDSITAGEIYFLDQCIDKLKEKELAIFRRKNMGFVFQAINLVPNLTLLENISLPGYLINKDRKKVHEDARTLMGMMDISFLTERLPSKVSGGQQQRAAIARALINNPRVLFADEPTGSLNSEQGTNVLDILTEINVRKGQTIVMVTHDVKAACRADRILFIKDGQIDGDLRLKRYESRDSDEREKQLFTYLSEKGW